MPRSREARAATAADDEGDKRRQKAPPMTAVIEETTDTSPTEVLDETVPPDTLAGIVEALTRALELHDYRRGVYGETSAHTDRVTKLACRLAERVAPDLATDP